MSVFPNTRAWEQQKRNKIKKTDEEGKKRGVSTERSKAGLEKKSSTDGQSHPNQNIINKQNIVLRYGRGTMKFNNKNQNGLK